VLNSGAKAAHSAWLLIPIGLAFAVIYYFVFRWVIIKWNLSTPGREDDSIEADLEKTAAT
jgi:PTS system N-acetylglucosamine-specific IIC component